MEQPATAPATSNAIRGAEQSVQVPDTPSCQGAVPHGALVWDQQH